MNDSGQIKSQALTVRQKIILWATALTLPSLSMIAHLIGPTTWHLEETAWQEIVAYHQTVDIFKIRPLTTSVVVFLHDSLGIDFRTSFYSLQLALYFFASLSFFYLLHKLEFNFRYCIIGVFIFGLSLPIFLFNLEPVHTWSDFWAYALVPLGLALTLDRKYIPAFIAFGLALSARETTMIFLPFWAMLIRLNKKSSWKVAICFPLLAIALSVLIRVYACGSTSASPHYSLVYNFDGWLRTSDSIFSLMVTLGFVWVVGLWQSFQKETEPTKYINWLKIGAVVTTLVFIGSTFLFGRARESRLFFMPAVFLIPMVLVYLRHKQGIILNLWRSHSVSVRLLVLTLILAGSIGLSVLLFPRFEYRRWIDVNRVYLGLHFWFTTIFLMIQFMGRKFQSKSHSEENS